MLTTTIGLAEQYEYLTERFQKAYAFLKQTDFSQYQEPCEIEIDGRDVYAQVQIYETKPADECRFEAHRRYFDIQYMAQGEEYMGFLPKDALKPDTDYDPETDLAFFRQPAAWGKILLSEGRFAAVSPDDGHMPRCMAGTPRLVKKIVVKVRVPEPQKGVNTWQK